jgi:hypothetical protein
MIVMMWTIIICSLLALILVLFVIQYSHLSKIYYFDKSLHSLRTLRHDAMIELSNQVLKEKYSESKVIELRRFIEIVDMTVDNFKLLQKELFRFDTIKKLFKNINIAEYRARQAFTDYYPELESLKKRLSGALFTAFRTGFFFRFRFSVYLIRIFLPIIVRITYADFYKKITHTMSTYKNLKEASNDQHFSAC